MKMWVWSNPKVIVFSLTDDIQDKTPTWDLSPSSANRINNSKQHRMSMPPSVLAGHIDAANRGTVSELIVISN